MVASSTEHPLPMAWPLERLPAADLVRMLRIPLAQAETRLAALRVNLADPAWVAAALARMSVPALAAASLLARGRGMMASHALVGAAQHELGIDEEAVLAGAFELVREVLVVPLQQGHLDTFALVAPAAQTVAALLVDFDLPVVPAGELPRGREDDGRVLLAACMALRQVDIKITTDGRPYRAALRKLAKTAGLDEDLLESALLTANHVGLVQLDDAEILRPCLPRLRAVAARDYASLPALAALLPRLAEAGRPVSVAAVLRWLDRSPRDAATQVRALVPSLVGWLPGFRAGKLGEIPAVACAAAADERAAASVTPSFEVFLPPEARATDLVEVLACCEVLRIDRAITGRITKASITRAVAAGASGDAILAALTTACRTPVPQNVEAAIRDWAGVMPATVAAGRVVVVPPADAERVGRALASFAPLVLAPGVLLVGLDVPPREIAAALGRIGVVTVGTEPAPRALVPSAPTAYPMLPTGAASAYRMRIEAWRRGDPAERKVGAKHAPPADQLSDEITAVLEAWEERVGVRLDDHMFSLAASALEVLPPRDRVRILRAPSALMLQRELGALAVAGTLEKALTHARSGEPRPELALAWRSTGVREALDGASKEGVAIAIRTRGGDHVIMPVQLKRNGTTWFVLGTDHEDQNVAIPLTQILATASPESSPPTAPGSRPWHPAAGQAPPAGHLPCPCGSGERYRSCCRDAPSA